MAAPSGEAGSRWRRPAALEAPRAVGRLRECLRRKAGLEARPQRGGPLQSPGRPPPFPPRCFPASTVGRRARGFHPARLGPRPYRALRPRGRPGPAAGTPGARSGRSE